MQLRVYIINNDQIYISLKNYILWTINKILTTETTPNINETKWTKEFEKSNNIAHQLVLNPHIELCSLSPTFQHNFQL